MIRSFPNIVKQILKHLPTNDYPVLHSCLFFQIWLTFILDKSLTSMRDLFYLLNRSGITVDISTFSKACKQRCDPFSADLPISCSIRGILISKVPSL
jgi:putative transposase